MISINAISRVLIRYETRYRYLDVFAADVEDLDTVRWISRGGAYFSAAPSRLMAQMIPSGIIRFSLVSDDSAETNASDALLLGVAIGGILGATSKKDGALLIGMGLGLLIGALASADDRPRMNRVMALRYEKDTDKWNVFDGPLLRLAKMSLAPQSPDSDKAS